MPTKSKIQDQTFLFTGTLTEFTREQAEFLVEVNGGNVLSSVTAKLNYLVVGEEAGSKLAKAKALGTVKILTEKEFLKMLPKGFAESKEIKNEETNVKLKSNSVSEKKIVEKETKNNSSLEMFAEIILGKQAWMATNLDVASFKNGDPIPEVKSAQDWQKAGDNKQPAWCYYENKESNGKKYGKLYNSYAANDSRGLAPEGWLIPSNADWKKLEKYLGEDNAGYMLKSKDGWVNPSSLPHTEPPSEFDGRPGGVRYASGEFSGLGDHVAYITSNVKKNGDVSIRYLQYYSDYLGEGADSASDGYYIRCIKSK